MNRKILITTGILLFIDQISKNIAEIVLPLNETKTIIRNFFQFTLCYNEGAAWNILNNQRVLLCILSVLALIIIYHFIYCFKENMRNNIAFGLILGGLVGNFLDRLLFGHVRDFIDFIIFHYDFPVFNIADMAVVIGVFLLVIAIIKGEDLSETSSRRKRYKTR